MVRLERHAAGRLLAVITPAMSYCGDPDASPASPVPPCLFRCALSSTAPHRQPLMAHLNFGRPQSYPPPRGSQAATAAVGWCLPLPDAVCRFGVSTGLIRRSIRELAVTPPVSGAAPAGGDHREKWASFPVFSQLPSPCLRPPPGVGKAEADWVQLPARSWVGRLQLPRRAPFEARAATAWLKHD